ncbi:recombinase family protein [Eubacteriales bacterium OttesenSCG-928-K08]|nr:recombinase family protein [Eubacteriales bacterium OttesenSCG-928-K08]
MAKAILAKYIRLSLDDAQTDSMSIENQRKLLNQHIADIDIKGATVLEFVDNGYSGTNFERPGVQELLELVREGKVNTIVVKDFSRFGRNALEMGYFIERVFPLYRVRFISVDDGFDSFEHEGDTGGLEVSFKFLIHEYYSRDLSKKITSARHEKMRRGEAVTKNCAYGYMLDGDRNMVIDPVAAKTVQLIFQMYSNGQSAIAIANRLYEEKILTPAAHKRQRRAMAQDEQFSCVWQKGIIFDILRDEQYTGMYVAGKTKVIDPVSHRCVKTAKEDWVRIPAHHPAIISQELFDEVQEWLRMKGGSSKKRKLSTDQRYAKASKTPLNGKVFCGHCGHSMRVSTTKNAAFHCKFTLAAPDAACHRLRISKAELEDALFAMITQQAKIVLNTKGVSVHAPGFEQQSDFSARIEKCHDEKRAAYERFILGEISQSDYSAEKADLEDELLRLEQAYTSFRERQAEQTAKEETQKVAKVAKRSKRLTQNIVDLLIDKVLVYPGGHLEVHWKISDFSNSEDAKNAG